MAMHPTPFKLPPLLLYVWDGWAPGYRHGGLAFAIARSEGEARALVVRKGRAHGLKPEQWGTLHVRPLSKRCAFAVGGGDG